jgi:hypothetical protein
LMVGARGFEPPTTCTPCMYATRLRYAPTRNKIVSATIWREFAAQLEAHHADEARREPHLGDFWRR